MWPPQLRTWTGQESELRRLWDENRSHEEIGAQLGHGTEGVRSKAQRLGLRRARKPSPWKSRETWLRELFHQGLSASRIADAMGISRNAVIGKLWRLGLSRPTPALTDDERLERLRERRRARKPVVRTKRARPMKSQPQATPAPAISPPSRNVEIWQLAMDECRWPTSPDSARPHEHRFCGAKCDREQPYCPHHTRMSYRPAA